MLQHTRPSIPSRPGRFVASKLGAALITAASLTFATMTLVTTDVAHAAETLPPTPAATTATKATLAGIESDEVAAAKLFFGTSVLWRNIVSTQTLDPSVAQTYNPYYGMAAVFRLQVWPVPDKLFVSTVLGVTREFTSSDFTTQADETLLGDLRLSVGSPSFYQIPVIEVDLGAAFTVSFPTSKFSQFQTMQAAFSGSLSVIKTFKEALAGMTFSYTLAATGFVHEFTTGGYEAEGANRCGSTGLSLGELKASSCLNSGLRNSQVRMVNTLSFNLAFIPEVGMSLSASFIHDFLYPQGDAVGEGTSFEPSAERSIRYSMAYGAEVWTRPWRPLRIAIGIEDANSLFDSDPDKPYRTPFDPFSSAIYLDIKLDIAQLAVAFME